MHMLIGAVIFTVLWTLGAFLLGTLIGKAADLADRIERGRR